MSFSEILRGFQVKPTAAPSAVEAAVEAVHRVKGSILTAPGPIQDRECLVALALVELSERLDELEANR